MVVLIVEDDASVSKLLQQWLDDAGYQALVAHDGEQALAVLDDAERNNIPIAGIVLDMYLPILTGEGFLEKREKHPTNKRKPIIIVTAMLDVASKARVDPMVRDVIDKPFDKERIMAAVRRYFGEGRKHDESSTEAAKP